MKPAFQIAARSWGKLIHTTWYQCPLLSYILNLSPRKEVDEEEADEYRRNNRDEADEHAASKRIIGL